MKNTKKILSIPILLFSLILHPCPQTSVSAEAMCASATGAVEKTSAIGKALLSSAKVYTTFTESATYRYHGGFERTVYSNALHAGSAVIYKMDDDNTYLLTNYHVVYDEKADTEANGGHIAREIYCYLYGSESSPSPTGETDETYNYPIWEFGSYAVPCEYVGGSVTCDLAVLRANTQDVLSVNDSFRAVEIAEDYRVGETAIAIGNPNGEGISVTQGIISVDSEYIQLNIDGTTREYRSVRIDTPLYAGNSGGGLFNENGQLIGITNAGNGVEENVNYAIPLPIVTGAAENILYYAENGEAHLKKIMLGIAAAARNAKYVYDPSEGTGAITEQIIVQSVAENSVAARMGIQSGDALTTLYVNESEYKLNRVTDLSDVLLTVREGDEIRFDYTRNGESGTTDPCRAEECDMIDLI